MKYDGNNPNVIAVLKAIGKKMTDVNWSEIDGMGFYPVVDRESKKILGVMPIEGFNGIEFEIDQTHDCVWESGIHDNRPNVFPYVFPYYDSVEDD